MDEDVTVENPIKIITKEEIMEDLRMRAGVCDFAPLKQDIIVCLNTIFRVMFLFVFQSFVVFIYLCMYIKLRTYIINIIEQSAYQRF